MDNLGNIVSVEKQYSLSRIFSKLVRSYQTRLTQNSGIIIVTNILRTQNLTKRILNMKARLLDALCDWSLTIHYLEVSLPTKTFKPDNKIRYEWVDTPPVQCNVVGTPPPHLLHGIKLNMDSLHRDPMSTVLHNGFIKHRICNLTSTMIMKQQFVGQEHDQGWANVHSHTIQSASSNNQNACPIPNSRYLVMCNFIPWIMKKIQHPLEVYKIQRIIPLIDITLWQVPENLFTNHNAGILTAEAK